MQRQLRTPGYCQLLSASAAIATRVLTFSLSVISTLLF
jgi:hypothetical protein